jgi:Fe-S-cluster containining protein
VSKQVANQTTTVSAGDFLRWLAGIDAALQEEADASVPCDGCTVCCRSSQFVQVAPDETETLARIPSPLLFPAPHLPPGHVVMGYDERGHCPMLVDDRCSIYEHRPRACRTYDCRVFAATGIEPDSPLLQGRISQWEFAYPTQRDRDAHRSLRAAAARITSSENATRRAIRAIVERAT